jgi:plastocyanin
MSFLSMRLPVLGNCSPSVRLPLGVVVVLTLWIGLLVGPAGAQTNSEPAAVVGMTNTLSFTKDTVRVQVGETVRWKNSSIVVHTVTADPEKATMDKSVRLPEGAEPFHSGNLEAEETFEYTFETPGRYTYFCVPHEAAMRATVIVEAAGEG